MIRKIHFLYSFMIQRMKHLRFEKFNKEQAFHWKKRKLLQMAKYAVAYSKFYKELYRGINITNDLNIEALPIIQKADIVNNFDRLLTVDDVTKESLKTYFDGPFSFEKRYKNKYLTFHTSGSTGNPVYVVWRESVFGISLSNYYFRIRDVVHLSDKALYHNKRKINIVYIGITDDYVGGNSWVYGMKVFANIKILSVFSKIDVLINELNDFKPDIIFTKPSLLGELARKQNEGILNINLKNVIFAGEMISPVDALDIEKYFGMKPINSYSTCETGPVAVQIDNDNEGLKVFEDLVWVELVDDSGKPIQNYYEVGNIVITNLYNKSMPIIRYKIGDKAYFIQNKNHAPFSVISYIQGRGTSFFNFEDANGAIVHIAEFPFWSLYIPGILRYQIVQQSLSSLVAKIEFEKDISAQEKEAISLKFIHKIQRIIEPHGLVNVVKIEIESVEKISPNSAGKIQVTFPIQQK